MSMYATSSPTNMLWTRRQARRSPKKPIRRSYFRAASHLEGLEKFDVDHLQSALEAYAAEKGQKVFAYFPALRYSVSGFTGGPDLLPMLEVMGSERVLGRIHRFVSA